MNAELENFDFQNRNLELVNYRSGQNGMNSIGYCQQGYGYLQPQWGYHCSVPPREPLDFELTIAQFDADKEPLLNYGAKLRLLIADPLKGMHLREAIGQLKTALKEVYGKPA